MTVTFVDPLEVACRSFGDDDLAVKARAMFREGRNVDGFQYLGSGCYRTCYLGPDGVVYKIYAGDSKYNQEEAVRWRMLWKHAQYRNLAPLHRLIPVPGYREPVLAVEYVKGDRPSYERPNDWRQGRDHMLAGAGHIGIRDTHEGNWRFRTNGRPCLIDAGGNGYVTKPEELSSTEGCNICNPNYGL